MKNLFLFVIIFFSVAFLTSCGKDDSDMSGPEIKSPEINVDTPIVETHDGIQTTTLRWESKYVVSLTLQGEPVALSGSAKIPIDKNTNFIFVGKTQDGKETTKNVSVSVSITVEEIPTVVLTATPAVVPPEGALVHITWIATNANFGVCLNNIPYFNGETGVTLFVPANGDTLTFIAKGSGGETTAKLYIPVDTEIPNENFLSGRWNLVERYTTCEAKSIYHQPSGISGGCESDDSYSFTTTRVEYNLGNLLCEGEVTSVHYFDYHIVGDSLFGLGKPRFLNERTADTLIWEFEDTWNLGNGTIVPKTIQEVFVASN